jgi:acyl-CoA reductase-like NAD-dependent aldehyde dehydrogenase
MTLHLPVVRWGQPYRSLDVEHVVHFATGEPLAEVSQANAGLVSRDMRRAAQARERLREIPWPELVAMIGRAADLFMSAELPMGDGTQTPDQFVTCQSATTGLPEHMCRLNMGKLNHVLTHLDEILQALTRRLDPSILAVGYGREDGVMRSYQATAPVLGVVLPSNSPGVHGLWLPVPALQVGLVLKPGPQEPWTPYRMVEALAAAGLPREAFSVYPGGPETGAAVLEHTSRTLIFGSTATVEQYAGNPGVQVHGPGFSKILFGDDMVDRWEEHLDLLVDSVLVNSGRSCISCSGIWASRHGRAIAEALAERLGPVGPTPPDDPDAALAAFTVPKQAEGIDAAIDRGARESGVTEVTAARRDGDRLIMQERCAYLRPTVIHCDSPGRELANTEYMFPFVSVVDIPTIRLDWLQPHEGNIIDFLFRARALQMA